MRKLAVTDLMSLERYARERPDFRTRVIAHKRNRQQVDWMWASVEDRLLSRLRHAPGVKRLVPRLEREVREGTLTATLAAQRVLDALGP